MRRPAWAEPRRWAGPVLLVAAGAYMLRLSWFRWPDVLIDYGTELYVPWQLAQGKVLYRDVGNGFGPLADYFNALLFRLFGVGLSTLVSFNIGLIALVTVLVHRLLRRTHGELAATMAGLCFLLVFACSQYVGLGNYNFVCPYAYELTYGLALSLAALQLLGGHPARPTAARAAAVGFLLGLVFLTKVEVFLAAAVAIVPGLALSLRFAGPGRRGQALAAAAAFLLPTALFLAYFSSRMPPGAALEALLTTYRGVFDWALVGSRLYQQVSGFDEPARNLRLMLAYAAGQLAVLGAIALASLAAVRIRAQALRAALVAAVFGAVLWRLAPAQGSEDWLEIARPFPAILLALTARDLAALFAGRGDAGRVAQLLPRAAFGLFSTVLLLKMALNAHLYHYGFALLMPATLALVAALVHDLPARLARRGDRGVATALAVLFVLLACGSCVRLSGRIYALKDYAVGTGRDRFLYYGPGVSGIGPIVNETLGAIERLMPPGDSFVLFPDGMMLNYLSRRPNPTVHGDFVPVVVASVGERNLIRALAAAPPSFVLVTEKDTSEHGARYFGRDYAVELSAWLRRNYRKVLQIGQEPLTGRGYGVIIARRRDL